MNSVKTRFRKFGIGLLFIVASGVLITACNKSDNDNIDIPAAGLMAFNLAPDQPAVGIALSGNSINASPLGYTAFTGQYINIYPGNRSVEAYDFISNAGFTESNFNFEPDKYYSLFVVGADSVYKNIVVPDNFDSLSASNGKAYIRFVNAIPDSSQPVVKINSGATEAVNEAAPFTKVSSFVAVNPGSINIEIKNGGNISATRTIEVADKKAYTILFAGQPGELNNDKSIQIRFIQNGTLTDSTAKN